MTRWLGIDYGTKRIGIAVGSTDEKIASALTVIPAEPREAAIERILRLAGDYHAEGIVVGWPLNMDDSEGPQAKLSKAMAAELAGATDLDVRLWDERLTSFAADKALAGKLTRKKRRARHDAVAAAKILQDFLAANGPASAPRPDELNQ
jgi:putative Holliday junction resolvase